MDSDSQVGEFPGLETIPLSLPNKNPFILKQYLQSPAVIIGVLSASLLGGLSTGAAVTHSHSSNVG